MSLRIGVFVLSLAVAPVAVADVTFTVEFEPGSKWFTESWSEAARNEMRAFLTDVGKLFRSNATATISVTDDATTAYASAGALWWAPTAVHWREGQFQAPALWNIIVKGIDTNGAAADVVINWNMDLSLYSGDSARLIENIRGLGRHEMHHAFGASAGLRHTPSQDPRGSAVAARLLDSLARDLNDTPLIGTYIAQTDRFTVNNYAIAPNWTSLPNETGLYFAGRNARGEVVKMPFYSSSTSVDFAHIVGISYVVDHPTWSTYVEPDLNVLRALGYPLAADTQLTQRSAITRFRLNGGNAEITVSGAGDRWYRLATSRNLRDWTILPEGTPGSGGDLTFTRPINRTVDPALFFQVVAVP